MRVGFPPTRPRSSRLSTSAGEPRPTLQNNTVHRNGSSPTTQLNVEALWSDSDRADGQNERYCHVGVGLEQRLTDNVWLSIAMGRQIGRSSGANALQVTSAFNWGLGPRN